MGQSEALPQFPFKRPDEGAPLEYEAFRKKKGLQKVELPTGQTAWLATRYDDVRALLGDNRFSADPRNAGYPRLSNARSVTASTEGVLPINYTDPPDHARLRQALIKEFTVARVKTLQPMIEGVIEELADKLLAAEQPADLINQFALPVPTTVILKMLGISYSEHGFFKERANLVVTMDLPEEVSTRAQDEIRGRMLEIIHEKEKTPGACDDIIGRLISKHIQAGNLSYTEACGLCQSLVIAGHETTANMIGLGMLSLLRRPDVFERLRNDNSSTVAAQTVEEMLRYWTTVNYVGMRVALEDVDFGDVTIKAGEAILPQVVAANYDPDLFSDPGRFDIDRQSKYPHLAFGFGIHQCIGQQLARMELRAVFDYLPKRIPTLRLAVPVETLEFNRGSVAHSLHTLPLAW